MNLFIYCAGGFGREIADLAGRLNTAQGKWEQIAFLDDCSELSRAGGIDIYRMEDAVRRFGAGQMEGVVANGEPFIRKALMTKLQSFNVKLATLVDATAVISPTATIGAGTVIFPNCYVSSMARIDCNVAIIAGSMIGHDSHLGENCVLSGHVNIGGGCMVGSETYIGMGSQLKEGTQVGSGSVIGMGSIVFGDVPCEVIAMGNPCRPLRPNSTKRIFKKVTTNAD